MVDPVSVAAGIAALKSAFDVTRSALALAREVGSKTSDETERQAVDDALASAVEATKIAEAQVARALGYELCKCKFPPTPMLTVGVSSSSPA